jgi:hypothetical protein
METGSILIKEKCKKLSKMSDRVSQMFWSTSILGLKGLKEFIEAYSLSYNYNILDLFYLRNIQFFFD